MNTTHLTYTICFTFFFAMLFGAWMSRKGENEAEATGAAAMLLLVATSLCWITYTLATR